jgi:hypothetical protein
MANVCYTTIEFEFTYEDESGETNVANETVTLRVGMDETIAALQEVGVLDEDHQLRTELEEVVWQYDSLGVAAEEAD